jgi:hypothetical protein
MVFGRLIIGNGRENTRALLEKIRRDANLFFPGSADG